MIDDEGYVDRLREIFAGRDPADGIDRHDGYQADLWVTDVVPAPAYAPEAEDELEVCWRVRVPSWLRRRSAIAGALPPIAQSCLAGSGWR